MTYKARLEIGVDSRDAKHEVDNLDGSLRRVERTGLKADKATRQFGQGARETALKLNKLRVAAVGFVGAIGGAAALRGIVRASDTYTNLRSQLRLVTESQAELNQVYEQTFKVAQDTRQDFEGTAKLYTRLAQSTDELGLSNAELLKITKAVNQSFVVSGADAQEAAGAVRQLAQGLGSGALRGDELNSVLENNRRLAQALAEGLGTTIGQLRDMGANGELTAEKILNALSETAAGIDRDFSKMERTVGQAMQQLRNDVLNALGPTETAPLVDAVDELRELVSDPSFRANIVSLTSGAIAGFSSLAEVIGNTADELRAIGALDPLPQDSAARLREINKELAELEAELGKGLWDQDYIRFGTDATIKERISQLRAEQDVLRNNLLVERELADERGESGGGISSPLSRIGGSTEKELKEEEDALQLVIDAAHARTEAFREAAQADADLRQARHDAFEDVKSSLRTEEEEILGSYERRRQIVIENTEQGSAQRRELLLRLEQETNAQLEQVNRGFWERYLASAQEALTSMDDIAAGTIQTFSGGMGSAFESMIFDAQTAREAFQQLGEGMARSIVNALGKMAAEWLAYQAVQLLVGKSTAASAASTMALQAQAMSKMAELNSFASTAAIPIVGPAAAPGAAAVAAGFTEPLAASVGALAFAGSFNGGGYTGNGIRAGGIDGMGGFPAILHPRETVIDHTKGQGAGEQTIVNVHNAPPGSTVRERTDNGLRVVDIMIKDMEDDGPYFRQLSRRTGVRRIGE